MAGRRTPTFAFIVHPRDEDDMFRARCLSLLRTLSTDDSDFIMRVCSCPPTVVGDVLFGFSPFWGQLISIACLPKDVPSPKGRDEIVRAAEIMVGRGTKVIGLGALTSPATAGGAWLADQLPAGVTVTNGNAYTAAVLRQNVAAVTSMLSLDRRPRVAILGCTGSVGTTLSRLLASCEVDLILVGQTATKVRNLLGNDAPGALFSECLADIVMADIVVVLTNNPLARLTPNLIRKGAIVIDAAEPPNIPEGTVREWPSHIRILRGGRVRIPGYQSTYDLGLDDPSETFACLAETYLFVREGIHENSVGTPSPDLAERLERAAGRHGIRPSLAVPETVPQLCD
jgi:fatty aldehyde-generating acyl-ACP reductase